MNEMNACNKWMNFCNLSSVRHSLSCWSFFQSVCVRRTRHEATVRPRRLRFELATARFSGPAAATSSTSDPRCDIGPTDAPEIFGRRRNFFFRVSVSRLGTMTPKWGHQNKAKKMSFFLSLSFSLTLSLSHTQTHTFLSLFVSFSIHQKAFVHTFSHSNTNSLVYEGRLPTWPEEIWTHSSSLSF